MTKTIYIGDVPAGADHPPIFLAEIGSYYNGDADMAKSMMDKVVACREQVPHQPMVLKTEILDDPEICLPGETMETYAAKDGRVIEENYRELIERKAMPLKLYIPLFGMCVEKNMPFVVSVYDFNAADFAKKYGASALKIASANIVHIPLIRHVASMGLPMLIDTGRATLAEVYRAVDVARAAGCEDIILQHSPDGHPAPPKAHNLRILQTYADAFGLPTGLSDHHVGLESLYISIALGASVLEKGVHIDPEELDQDISHTMGLEDLPQVLQSVYDAWLMLGDKERSLRQEIDWVIGSSQRQCLVAKADLAPGERISLKNTRFAFPCKGIPVEDWDLVEGWEIYTSVTVGSPIKWAHVKPRDI